MAKDPAQRYQRGSEFADDLKQLQQPSKQRSTTTSLQAAAATGTRSAFAQAAATGVATASSEKAVEQAEKVVNHILFKAPVRDLVLGAATIVLLVIVGTQSKMLVSASKTAVNSADSAISRAPVSGTDFAITAKDPVQPRTVQAVPVPSDAPKKVPAKVATRPKPTATAGSTLDLAVQHQFKDATLFVWVDDKLILTRPLHGGAQKKLVVFNGIRGVDSESLKIPAGKHLLRFRALSTDKTVDLSKTVSAEFVEGDTKSAQLTFDKHNSSMRLTWE
jgi:hypothetical protein